MSARKKKSLYLRHFLFFGRGRERGGRATAKHGGFRSVVEMVLPYNEADGNGEQDFFILFPVFGGEMARQKSRLSRVKGGDFFCVAPAAEKILPVP